MKYIVLPTQQKKSSFSVFCYLICENEFNALPNYSHAYRLYFLAKDRLTVTKNGQTHCFEENTFFVTSPKDTVVLSAPENSQPLYYGVLFLGQEGKDYLRKMNFDDEHFFCSVDPYYAANFKELFLNNFHVVDVEMMDTTFLKAFISIVEGVRRLTSTAVEEVFPFKSAEAFPMKENQYVTATIEYVETHFTDPNLSREQIAKHVNIHEAYVSKLFKLYTGVTLSDYILQKRISLAEELLKNTQKNIKEISFAVGYTDPLYFTKKFKLVKKTSPQAYRKLIQNK